MSAETMRAAVLPEFGADLEIREVPVPEPGPGEALVKIRACGIGLTLEHIRQGYMGGAAPRIIGHEFSGTVTGVGAGVAPDLVGQAVTGSFYLFCGSCPKCASGRETLCERMEGYIGAVRDGALAEYAAIPARCLVPIPEGIPVESAGVIADAVATPLHLAVERGEIVPGDRVLVIGAGGGLGVHMVQMARAHGAWVQAVERDPVKFKRLQEEGMADVYTTGIEADRIDVAVDTVGNEATLTGALATLRPGGRLIALGVTPGSALPVDPMRLILEEIVVTGTRYATRAEIAQALELVRLGKVTPYIGARFPLTSVNDAFKAIRANEVFGRVIIDVD